MAVIGKKQQKQRKIPLGIIFTGAALLTLLWLLYSVRLSFSQLNNILGNVPDLSSHSHPSGRIADNLSAKADNAIHENDAAVVPQKKLPDLQVNDFIVERYLGSGAINIGLLASLPKDLAIKFGLWDFEKDEPVKLVLKLIHTHHYNHTEVEAFERLMSVDKDKAEKVGLLQALYIARDVENPYFCQHAVQKGERWSDRECVQNGAKEAVDGMSNHRLLDLRTTKAMDAMALRYYEKRFIHDTAKNIRDYKIYFKSVLEQLALAHASGTNNRDLNENRNLYVESETGRAILFDWNGHISIGGVVFDREQHYGIAAPEGWLEEGFGVNALTTHIHAFDIWQAGIMWTNILYRPCQWPFAWVMQGKYLQRKKRFLRKLIDTLGGNTVIPINEKESVDLRKLAGLSTEYVPATNEGRFRPLLSEYKKPDVACHHKSWYLDDPNVPEHDKEMALDFIKRALTISPSDRPSADELLRHPIFEGIELR
eukprot:scaffold9946_cov188-Amphora_coffeaeformis.AAC.4